MKNKTLVVAALMLTISGCGSSNSEDENTQEIKAEVLEAFKGLANAVEALDAERYLEYFDKEFFTGLNADGTVWHSIDSLEAQVSSGFPLIEENISLEFNNLKVTVINPITAILVNEYEHSMLLKNGSVIEQAGGGSQVWSKSNGAWKLVSVSASAVSH